MSIWSNLGLVYALLGAAVAVFLAGAGSEQHSFTELLRLLSYDTDRSCRCHSLILTGNQTNDTDCGKPFEPFKSDTKYVDIKEETLS